jgi:hypothetical protein
MKRLMIFDEFLNESISDLQKMMNAHDWYYMYSDDSRAWDRGRDSERKILDLVKKLGDEAEKLYREEHQKQFPNKK